MHNNIYRLKMADIQGPDNSLLIAKKNLEIKKQLLVVDEFNYKIMLAQQDIKRNEGQMKISGDYIAKLQLELKELQNL